MLQQRQRPEEGVTSSYYFWIMRKPSQNVSAALTLLVLRFWEKIFPTPGLRVNGKSQGRDVDM